MANELSEQQVSLREIAKRIGPLRGKILSAQSVKSQLEKWDAEGNPAMATGLEDHVWTIRELIEESAKA